MSKAGRRAYLTRALSSHAQGIQEIFQMLDKAAVSSLDKVDWSEVTKLGDEISKQATIAGMLWSGETLDVKELEENMGVYCNVLQGFVLLCHGSTVGAVPTLHASIRASVKQVVDSSLSLLREAVSSCESHSSDKKLTIPQLSGSVWEACVALKKTPTTNCTAIGRAITQVAVSVKDVLREMRELKPATSSNSTDGAPDEASDMKNESHEEDGWGGGELGSDLSPKEMSIVQLAIDVVSDTLLVMKEVIRFVTGLLRKPNDESITRDCVDSLERLLSYCQEFGVQINDLGGSLYPPQEICLMNSAIKKICDGVDGIRTEVGSIGGSTEGLFRAFEVLQVSLGKLDSGLGCLDSDLEPEMGRLAV